MSHLSHEKLEFTVSRELRHDEWDTFLSACPSGQFQQSSLWARVKAAESWECARLLARRDGRLLGGAQLLFRSSRLGRIGYVSKGPVLAPGEEVLFPSVLEELRTLGPSLRLKAWILQPPDEAAWQMPVLAQSGYLPAYVMRIIDSTLLLDLSRSWDDLLGNVNRSTRQRAHQAERAGMRVREGTEEDVGSFFELMLETCRRQRTKPNPASASALLELWRTFSPGGGVRLTFAEKEGTPLAGLLCIVFGRRVTLWKKGWNSSVGPLHPNELLHLEAIRWAWENRYQCCDFLALDRGIAEAMLAGRPLDPQQKRSRHLFNVKLGTAPRLLPPALIYVADPRARALYRGAGRLPVLTALLRKTTMGFGRS
jgi:lipid II:glycine glycyltransferase (peptidoglycan interpeptide bridge formation enzyme)